MSAVSPGAADEETSARSSGPGHLLRTARESAGIGVREVSAQLRLDERTVVALESYDFKALPAPTFVRGYLRGYARLLGLPVGPVMEAYDREGFNPPDLVADIAETPDASTTDFPVRLASIGVVGVLVILVVLWWNNQAFNELPTPIPEADGESGLVVPLTPATPSTGIGGDQSVAMQGGAGSRDESEGDPVTPPPAAASDASPGEATTASDASESSSSAEVSPETTPASTAASSGETAADQAIARAEGVLERTRNEVNAIVGGAGQASSDTPSTPGAAADATTQASSDSSAAESAAAGSASGGAGETGPARLVMRFPIESWVEVYDRNNERLFYNLAKPGRVVDVTGAPPIRILLGRTRGVTVTYNGESVDLAPYIERGVARLTLGQ
jgi:cytoskeleton protein RodZ